MRPWIILILATVAIAAIGCQNHSNSLGPGGSPRLLAAAEGTAVGDRVWNDENGNGIQDSTEAGLADVAVELYTCDSALVATTTTDSTGAYIFDNLEPGSYFVHFVLPEGYRFSPARAGDDGLVDSDADGETGNTGCLSLEQDQQDGGLDAGMYLPGVCTRSKGYWKNHAGFGPQADVVTDLLPIWLGDDAGEMSLAVEDAQTAVNVLSQFTYGEPSNGMTKLYAQLLAAKLNSANGASVDEIASALTDVDLFLADHDWEDWDSLGDDERHMVMEWKDLFDAYNNGFMGPEHCGDDDSKMDDSDGE